MMKMQRFQMMEKMVKNDFFAGTSIVLRHIRISHTDNFPIKTKALRLIIAVFIILISGLDQSAHAQAWFNTSWGSRKSHLITGSSGAGTNYQIRIVVHKATGTDATSDVFMGSNVKNDFGDVRFTTSDGTTLLNYWLETGSLVSGSQAAFWIQVAADLGSNQTIFVYYGNNSATTTSNGTSTFILFDDFTGSSLATQWTRRNGGTPTFSGGLMTVSSNNIDPSKIIATGGPTANNNAMVARFEVTAGTDADERAGIGVRTANAASPIGYNYLFHDFTSLTKIDFLNDQVTYGSPISFSWAKNTFFTMESFTDGTSIYGRVNYGTWNSQTLASLGTARGTNFLSLNIGSKTGTTTVWDWAAIRKCIATEPANSTWGVEQTVPPAITSFTPSSGCANTTPVVITGTNFTGATAVKFGGTNALSFTVNSATQITATPAAGTTGTISVTTPGGTGTSTSTFTVNSMPLASVNSQTNVNCFGGTDGTITILGSNGTGPYNYSVDNGVNWTPALPALPNPYVYPGLIANQAYRIRVRDNNGCISK